MRYFNASSQPYVSDFVPQDLNLIYKMQQDMVNEDNNALLNLEKAKTAFNIDGGYSTKLEAQKLNQAYNQEANKISEGLASGKLTSKDATRQILTLANHFSTNPEVKAVKTDASFVPQVDQMLKENPGFLENGLAQGWNPKTKQWNRINVNYGLEDFKKHYEGVTPTLYSDDFKEWYAGIKPNLDKELEKETWNVITNPDGTKTSYSTINGLSKEQITREKVRQLATDFVNSNEGVYNKKSVRYDQLANSQFPGSKFGNNDIIENLVNSYPGYYEKTIESQKQGKSITTKAPKEESYDYRENYTTPQTTIQGIKGDFFDIKKAGSVGKYSQTEEDAIYKKYGTSRNSIGRAAELAAASIAAGKPRSKDEYTNIISLPKEAKEFALSGIKLIAPNLYDKAKNGQLTFEEQNKIYPQLKQMQKLVNEDILQNSNVITYDTKERKEINNSLFGDGVNTVERLGSGTSGNLKFYNKSTGKIMSLKEIKENYDSKDVVTVNGEFSPENPYSLVTNDSQFINPKQLFINGEEIIVSGPSSYTTSSGGLNNPKQYKLERNKNVNKIYNTKFGTKQVLNLYGLQPTVGFNATNEKPFNILLNGKINEFYTAADADQYILEEAIKLKSKK